MKLLIWASIAASLATGGASTPRTRLDLPVRPIWTSQNIQYADHHQPGPKTQTIACTGDTGIRRTWGSCSSGNAYEVLGLCYTGTGFYWEYLYTVPCVNPN